MPVHGRAIGSARQYGRLPRVITGNKDLMARMGHDSERAAMIYLHKMRGADPAIASAIDTHVNAERGSHDDARPPR